ncbi:MAG: CDP-diacylglycerol--glycerol-3-phosphate 3-phosphatidyltransferase [Clostridia bacterium]
MWKKMNLPNKITMLRMILVPIFVIIMCLPSEWNWAKFVALGIYIVAAATDFVDGYLSRKNNIVTKFGKIMDPLADKLLVSAGFIMLTGAGIVPAWITAIIIFRDFFVNALRMFGSDNGKDVAAVLSGKIKTIFQLIGVPLALLGLGLFGTGVKATGLDGINVASFGAFFTKASSMGGVELLINVGMTIAISAAVIATIWSLVEYILKFKEDINVEE